jgi:DNA repair protein RadC
MALRLVTYSADQPAQLHIEPRPRQKLTRDGAQSLSDVELLSILLGSGSGEHSPTARAQKILEKYHGLRGLAAMPIEKLTKSKDFGPVKSQEIVACIELGRRLYARAPQNENPIVASPQDVADYLMPRLTDPKKEHFFAVLLDVKSRVIRLHTVSIGTLDSSLVHPREVFKEAIAASSSSVIVAHNHPSGDPSPSSEDKKVTTRLVEAGKLLGIDVLDHIVFGEDQWCSLKQLGLM